MGWRATTITTTTTTPQQRLQPPQLLLLLLLLPLLLPSLPLLLLLLQLLLTNGIGRLVQRAVPASCVLIDGSPALFRPHLPLHHHTDNVMDEDVLVLNTTRHVILQWLVSNWICNVLSTAQGPSEHCTAVTVPHITVAC